MPRTPDFWRWRIHDNPRDDELLLLQAVTDDEPLAVARLIKSDRHRRLNILALTGQLDSQAALSRLFASILRWALQQQLDEVIYATSDPAVAAVASRWLPIRIPMIYASHANDPDGEAFLDGENHRWEAIDSDIDLAQY